MPTTVRCACRADLETDTIRPCLQHATMPHYVEELTTWHGWLALAACVLSTALMVYGVWKVGAWLARVAG